MGSYMAYRPRSCDRREYIAESGVYISTAREYEYIAGSGLRGVYFQPQGSILLSQGCIFSTAREYIAESGVYIWQSVITATQRNGKLFVLQIMEWPIPPSPHYSL